ncbi:MAG: LapA family protein [Alphaproteobacteria bacterium]
MKFLWRLVGLVVALVVITFATSNREATIVNLWPLPWQLTVPVYAVVLCAIAFGVLAGGLGAWRAGGRARAATRALGRQVADLRTENDALRRGRSKAATPSGVPVAGQGSSKALPAARP